MVDNIQQRLAIVLHRGYQLQRTNRELIEAHIALFLNTRNARNMGNLRMQRLLQVLQNGTSSNDATLQMVDAKTLQRLHVEVLV